MPCRVIVLRNETAYSEGMPFPLRAVAEALVPPAAGSRETCGLGRERTEELVQLKG